MTVKIVQVGLGAGRQLGEERAAGGSIRRGRRLRRCQRTGARARRAGARHWSPQAVREPRRGARRRRGRCRARRAATVGQQDDRRSRPKGRQARSRREAVHHYAGRRQAISSRSPKRAGRLLMVSQTIAITRRRSLPPITCGSGRSGCAVGHDRIPPGLEGYGPSLSRYSRAAAARHGIHHFDMVRMIFGEDVARVACRSWNTP